MDFRLDSAITMLERTPAVLSTTLRGLPPEWLTCNEGADTWNPIEVVGHLIHGERTDWIPRARIILEQGESRPFDRYDRLAQRQWLKDYTPEQLLETFGAVRKENLGTLRGWNLSAADLGKTGMHPALGRVTLSQLLASWVVHDLDHVTQIARTQSKQYAEAVGPWTEYMSVLHDRIRRGTPTTASS